MHYLLINILLLDLKIKSHHKALFQQLRNLNKPTNYAHNETVEYGL